MSKKQEQKQAESTINTSDSMEAGVTEIASAPAAVAQSDSMVADLDQAEQSTAVVVDGAAASEAETESMGVVKVANADDALSGDRVRVTFFEQDGPGGKEPVFASLNGFAYHIPRNVQVDLPVEVLAIFDNANETRYEKGKDGADVPRIIKRFSYQVHGLIAKKIAA